MRAGELDLPLSLISCSTDVGLAPHLGNTVELALDVGALDESVLRA